MVHINMKLKREPLTIEHIENSQANFVQLCKNSGIDSLTRGAILKCFDQAVLYTLGPWHTFDEKAKGTWPKENGRYLVQIDEGEIVFMFWTAILAKHDVHKSRWKDPDQGLLIDEQFITHWQPITPPKASA